MRSNRTPENVTVLKNKVWITLRYYSTAYERIHPASVKNGTGSSAYSLIMDNVDGLKVRIVPLPFTLHPMHGPCGLFPLPTWVHVGQSIQDSCHKFIMHTKAKITLH